MLLVFFSLLAIGCSAAVLDHPPEHIRHTIDVYWNSSNKNFASKTETDRNSSWTLNANEGDSIRFHCPTDGANQHLLIYKVNKIEFDNCFIGEFSHLVANCSGGHHYHNSHHFHHHRNQQKTTHPRRMHSMRTVKYHLRRPDESDTVYFISTSNGERDGVDNEIFGLCLTRNMRLAVNLSEDYADYSSDYDSSWLHQGQKHDGLVLAEENGDLNWKRNVAPPELLEKEGVFTLEPLRDDDVNRVLAEEIKAAGIILELPKDVKVLDEEIMSEIISNDRVPIIYTMGAASFPIMIASIVPFFGLVF